MLDAPCLCRGEVPAMNEHTLRQNAADFVVYKKSLGYVYDGPEGTLERYVRYAEDAAGDIGYPRKDVVDKYLESISGSAATLYHTACVLREFSRYLQMRGCKEAYMIPPKMVSLPIAEEPYFFMPEEIDAFFEKLDSIKPHKSFKGREYVFPALFRLLYCCGLRCKEARTLECANVNTDECYVDVTQSKGPKSRRIFISRELSGYLNKYDENISLLFPKRKFYFPHGSGCYSAEAISENFKRFWKQAFPDFVMAARPRAYDFRHHFAWSNLNRWAADGLDVNVMLPYLMRYMGHQSVSATLYYFRFVPEFFPAYRVLAKPLEDILPEVPDEE